MNRHWSPHGNYPKGNSAVHRKSLKSMAEQAGRTQGFGRQDSYALNRQILKRAF